MLAILVDAEIWEDIELGEDERIIGQSLDQIVLQVESVPNYEHEDITSSDLRFMQRAFDGKYGEAITYKQFLEINSLLEEVGEADSFEGLLKKKIDLLQGEATDVELALISVYEEVLGNG